MTSTTLPLSNGTLSFRVAGSGPPLVLVHGVGLSAAIWQPQIDALSKTHRVIVLDMPGHGDSAPLAGDAPLEAFVSWLHEALKALAISPVSIAGHSMGALIALGYTATYPQNVTRVALLNGVYRRTDKARAAVLARAEEIASGALNPNAPLDRWFDAPSPEKTLTAKLLSQVSPEGYATAYRAFATGDDTYADALAHITCPLLALTGEGDANSSAEMARTMARIAPDGEAYIIEGHHHMAPLTAAKETNAALTKWLDRQPQAAKDQTYD